jgi:hypothetical protein
MQSFVRGYVGLRHNETLLQSNHTGEVQEEALAGAETTDDETHSGAAIVDLIKVAKNGCDLFFSANLNMSKSNPRHNPCSK